MGPRGGRLGRPRIVFILGQPALHQGGLEGANRLLAVLAAGVALGQMATVSGACCYLVPRLCDHGASPVTRLRLVLTAAAVARRSASRDDRRPSSTRRESRKRHRRPRCRYPPP